MRGWSWTTLRRHTRLGAPWLLRRFLRKALCRAVRARSAGTACGRPRRAARAFTPAAFGHTGFTGTSLWIDPVLDLYVVLLTNRVHPHGRPIATTRCARLRPLVHEAIVEASSCS